jgi:hypothetical protein
MGRFVYGGRIRLDFASRNQELGVEALANDEPGEKDLGAYEIGIESMDLFGIGTVLIYC